MERKLTEICDIQYGYAFNSGCFTDDSTYPPLIRIRDVKRGYSETFYNGEYPPEYVIRTGSLLIGMDGEFNIARWRGGDALLNQRVCRVAAKIGTDEEYLRFALSKALKEIEARTAFVTVKHLSAKELNALVLMCPNYDTQREISVILSKIENTIAIRQHQLQKLDELVKARFVELFGAYAETTKLSDVATVSGGLTKNTKRDKLPLRMPYLRVANVSFASIDVSEMLDIGLTEEEYEKTLLHSGDLLFVEGNGSPDQIGRVAIWNNEVVPCVHQNHLIKSRFDKGLVIPAFVMYYFMSPKGREQIRGKAVSTSGLYTLSVSKISDLLIPVPPLELQNQFATFVEQVDKSKVAVQKALDEAQLLFDSLMQKWFR